MTTTQVTLFGRLGGADVIAAVTDAFCGAVQSDPVLGPRFEGVDMYRQAGMLAAFLTLATGGPGEYRGRDLREAHAGMNLTSEEFDLVTGHLTVVLGAAGVPFSLIAEVRRVAESVRGEVLGG